MNDAKHTPGPWHAGAMSGDVFAIKNRGTIPVCAVPEDGSPNWEADARLIAAAPELLDACKKALTCGLDSSVRALVVAAIAKAEGR